MRPIVCRLAPAASPAAILLSLSLAALAPGCFESRGREEPSMRCDCCGTSVVARPGEGCGAGVCDPFCGPRPDAARPRDAGPLDAGADCGARIADVVCSEDVRAGEPSTLEVVMGLGEDCFCGQDIACEVSIEGPRVLSLRTSLCPLVPICRACAPHATGTCDVPPLEVGEWTVRLDGRPARTLIVAPSDVPLEWSPSCVRRSLDDGCALGASPEQFSIASACHASGASEGQRLLIQVTDECGGCTQVGPCAVDVQHDIVHVRPTRLANTCEIACPPACFEQVHVCLTPPLAAGDYRVLVHGALPTESRLRVGPGADSRQICATPRAVAGTP